MSTNINIIVGGSKLVDEARLQTVASRQAQLEKEAKKRLEAEAIDARTKANAAAGKDANGNLLYGAPSAKPDIDRRPAANRAEQSQGWGIFWAVGRRSVSSIFQDYATESLRPVYTAGKVYIVSGDRTTYALLNDTASTLSDGLGSGGFYRVYPIKGDRAIVVFRSSFTENDGMVVVSKTGARRLPYTTIPSYFRDRVIGIVPTNYNHWQRMGWAPVSSGIANLSGAGLELTRSGIWDADVAIGINNVVPWSIYWSTNPTITVSTVSNGADFPALQVHGPGPHKLIEWGITISNQTDETAYPSTAVYSPYDPDYWGLKYRPIRLDAGTAWGTPQQFKIKTFNDISAMLETSTVFYDVADTNIEPPYGIESFSETNWKTEYSTFLVEANSLNLNPTILSSTKWKRSNKRVKLSSPLATGTLPEGQNGTPIGFGELSYPGPVECGDRICNSSQEYTVISNTDGNFTYGTFTGTYVLERPIPGTDPLETTTSTTIKTKDFMYTNTILEQHVFCDWGEDWSERFLQYGLTEADLTP